ncbi:MAG: hypothetical protein QM767_19895 [Anaeromyxobacter sp.]
MSEYQWYEFVALDRPLTGRQMTALRRISSRATITPTRFWNEYHWGDLKADPAKLLERYFDAHLYFANWGTHRLMLRLPAARVKRAVLAPYFPGSRAAQLTARVGHLVIDLVSGEDEPPEFEDDEDAQLAVLSGARAELMAGDLRPAYLAWLLAVQEGELDGDAVEPSVPAGLGSLTAAQEAMASLLRIDACLLAAAATRSAETHHDRAAFRRWVGAMPAKTKDAWLRRAADDPSLALGAVLLRNFQARSRPRAKAGQRTVAGLLALAEERRPARRSR